MQYEITLRHGYTYTHPVGHARHLLRLQPRTVPGMQRVIAARLDTEPQPPERSIRTDFFGNIVHSLHFLEDHAEIEISLVAYVERQSALPVLDFAPSLERMRAELASHLGLGPDSPLHFLGFSPRIPDFLPFRDFALAAIAPGMSPVDAMRAIGAALSTHMKFDGEATTVDTTPIEAFDKRRGVCQDYSQIMIASLRAIGIPAAYVSGFLRTIPPPGKERLPGADAMHAWVRVWCGEGVGWLEYDPTNAMAVGDDHVLVGYGRDYADVAPIRGVSRMVGGQSSRHSVDVVPVG